MNVMHIAAQTITAEKLATPDTPVLLMVSGGSDSTALAYIAKALRQAEKIGPVAMLHVNHKLRGADADTDAAFVAELADLLEIPLFSCDIDIPALVEQEKGNMEAIARRERYAAAREALTSLCRHEGVPVSEGRIFTAHTADDRVENFYMRSIVGTGPGGFRSMLYLNGQVARPLLDLGRQDLRDFIKSLGDAALFDAAGNPWREDATNEHTDRFRAFVRAEIIPQAKERNTQLLQTLTRTMNLIADEDDMLNKQTQKLEADLVAWASIVPGALPEYEEGCVISPDLGAWPTPMRRRLVARVLGEVLGTEARVEAASVEAVLAAWEDGTAPAADEACALRPGAHVVGGYVANIQGNLAVSANKHGVRIEPMATFRARRKRI